ncbi:ATP-binding protein [Candidatus Thorarchaeota archaeon]|nr:MAG: ATP-binding protein [Candidatus Thorarchaeota archaeon]
MPFHLSFKRTKKEDSSFKLEDSRSILWINRVWILGIFSIILYFLIVYILPLYKVITTPLIPFKTAIEIIVCLIPIFSGAFLSKQRMEQTNLAVSVENEMMLIDHNGRTIGLCCLEIMSTASSISLDDKGYPKYNASMLLAMRSGMDKSVNMAFEAGISEGEPFLRIFITATGTDSYLIKEIIRREATRAEAILLASLNMIDLRILEGHELEGAAALFVDNTDYKSGDIFQEIDSERALVVLKGSPRVNPSIDASQVGTFISTAMKKGYSVTMTCIFSAARPGRERKRLEGKWKTIQSKEKRKEESLKDHALKKQLVTQYEEIQDDVGWFDSTVYFVIKQNLRSDIAVATEGVRGLILSIWGGHDSFKLDMKKIKRRTALRLLSKSHLKKQRMHVSKLVSFVNTPVRSLPIIGPEEAPVFQIPSRESLGKDIMIGDTIFDGRPFSSAGLEIEWLREHVAVLGATGTGKTTLVKHLISQISEKSDIPWWIFDVKGSEYAGLIKHSESGITILRPGLDSSFVINLMDSKAVNAESSAYSTFIMLKELLKERGDSSELSPAMERLLRESVMKLADSLEENNSVQSLADMITQLASNDRMGQMTRDALLNRLQILFQEPLGDILRGGADAIDISSLLDKRIILDLSYVARIGGMDSARILYNLIAKRIFERAMKRGIVSGLRHIVVLEEANNLVPESYSKHSSADVTTGESMVLLQRATGQGVIVVSTRPNISSNILANTATKIVFRLPYDSEIGGKFLSLNEKQETYLRSMKCGRALVSIPDTETFEIATKLFIDKVIPESEDTEPEKEEMLHQEQQVLVQDTIVVKEDEPEEKKVEEIPDTEAQTVVFDRVGRFGNHVVAFLASAGMSTEQEIRELLTSLNPTVMEDDISEVIRDLVTLGTIEREALSLVPGGFVFTLPDNGLEAIRKVIVQYISDKLGIEQDSNTERQPEWPDMIVDEKAVVILPQHLRASSMESTMTKIRHYMEMLQNGISELFVVVRGSVAAAKLRELLDKFEEFDAVRVVSAFPSSLDSMIENLSRGSVSNEVASEVDEDMDLIGAMHDIGPATSRAIQIRLWFGLIQDFVDLSNGQIKWEVLLEFIETTALQSLKGRSAPLTVEEGRRALTELLADEVLIALRSSGDNKFVDMDQGLWIVNSSILKKLKETSIQIIETELRKHHSKVSRNHGYYDLCANNTSYVVFPNQQQLSTLLNLHSDIACRTCKSSKVVCILTASEYLEDSVVTPGNLVIKTMDDSVSALVT